MTTFAIDETAGLQNDGSGESENNDFQIGAGGLALPVQFDSVLSVETGGRVMPAAPH